MTDLKKNGTLNSVIAADNSKKPKSEKRMTLVNRKKFFAGIGLMLAVCLGSAGCESTASLKRHWVGKTKEALVASWGQPARIEEGPQGETIYIYTKTYYPDYEDPTRPTSSGVYTPPAETVNYPIRAAAESRTSRFWISPQGTIYRAEGLILE